jgi:ferritin-like metal-binding protein YciE
MTEMSSLRDAFIAEIKDLYDAEQQLMDALPRLAKTATNPSLRSALAAHLEETRGQVGRLEEVFELLDQRAKGRHCAGIAAIIEEASDALEEEVPPTVMDACIIAGGQRAEHYEMAAYGTAIAWAEVLELPEIAQLLAQTLDEERAAAETLTALAVAGINEAAANADELEDDEDDEDEDDEDEDEEDEEEIEAGPISASRSARRTRS